jgi:methylaspartate ammonia-lyase
MTVSGRCQDIQLTFEDNNSTICEQMESEYMSRRAMLYIYDCRRLVLNCSGSDFRAYQGGTRGERNAKQ